MAEANLDPHVLENTIREVLEHLAPLLSEEPDA